MNILDFKNISSRNRYATTVETEGELDTGETLKVSLAEDIKSDSSQTDAEKARELGCTLDEYRNIFVRGRKEIIMELLYPLSARYVYRTFRYADKEMKKYWTDNYASQMTIKKLPAPLNDLVISKVDSELQLKKLKMKHKLRELSLSSLPSDEALAKHSSSKERDAERIASRDYDNLYDPICKLLFIAEEGSEIDVDCKQMESGELQFKEYRQVPGVKGRRTNTPIYGVNAVCQALDSGSTVRASSKDLGISSSAYRIGTKVNALGKKRIVKLVGVTKSGNRIEIVIRVKR